MSLKDDLKRHEGLRLKPYKDTVGKITIGYGRNLDGVGITEEEADYLLSHDIQIAVSESQQAFTWIVRLSESRQNVIYNMAFNMGIPTLSRFRNMIAAIEKKDYGLAADEMLDSRWAKQVGKRAEELATIMREE